MKRLVHYITAKSSKGFGTQSPMVYTFLREVLHPQKKSALFIKYQKEKNKIVQLLLRMIDFYELKDILLLSEKCPNLQKHGINFVTSPCLGSKYDMVMMDTQQELDTGHLQEHCFVVLLGKNSKQNALSRQCPVFLNMYFLGICIFRRGLSKQQFRLRL